jgi:site-specific DNA recombinase
MAEMSLPSGHRLALHGSANHPVGHQGTTLELTTQEPWRLVTTIPAIVAQEVFAQGQGKLAANQPLAQRHTVTGAYRLRALVSCGICG